MDIHKLIAVINPEVFCQPKVCTWVQKLLRERLEAGDRLAYARAAAKTEPREPNQLAIERLTEINIFNLPGQRSPVERHVLILDRPDDALEPLYFGLLEDLERQGGSITKLVDTFTGRIGAGLSADVTRRVMQRQEQAVKVAGRIHARVRSLLHLWRKWSEKKQSLHAYDSVHASSGEERQRALEVLERRWRSHDRFHRPTETASTSAEFKSWLSRSETELRRSLEIERKMLTGELHLLKLEANWLRPYLHSLTESSPDGHPALAGMFNTALFEVVLLVELPSEIEHAVDRGDLPKMLLGRKHRRPRPVLLVEMRLRTVPEPVASGSYGFRGRAEIVLTSYALNAEELAVLRWEVQRSEYGEILGDLAEETSASFQNLLVDMDELWAEGKERTAEVAPTSDNTNPFSALFSIIEWFKPPTEPAYDPVIREPLCPDSDIEKVLRSYTLLEGRQACLEFYEHEKQRLLLPCSGFT